MKWKMVLSVAIASGIVLATLLVWLGIEAVFRKDATNHTRVTGPLVPNGH